jgi:hypothetical protein
MNSRKCFLSFFCLYFHMDFAFKVWKDSIHLFIVARINLYFFPFIYIGLNLSNLYLAVSIFIFLIPENFLCFQNVFYVNFFLERFHLNFERLVFVFFEIFDFEILFQNFYLLIDSVFNH